jgi:hypothetical protein
VEDGDTDREEERESERLRTENAAMRAELERMRARYEVPADPPARSTTSRHCAESTILSSAPRPLYGRGQELAAVGLMKYADVLLARFNLALARMNVGDAGWRDALSDPIRDAEFETWLAAQTAGAGRLGQG